MSIRKKKTLKNIQDLIGGEGVKVEESSKTKEIKEKEYFFELLEDLEKLLINSNSLIPYGVDLSLYEDLHFKVIEHLTCKYLGEPQGILVFWWLNSKIENPKLLRTVKSESGKEYKINTPTQLWNFLKKYNKINA